MSLLIKSQIELLASSGSYYSASILDMGNYFVVEFHQDLTGEIIDTLRTDRKKEERKFKTMGSAYKFLKPLGIDTIEIVVIDPEQAHKASIEW